MSTTREVCRTEYAVEINDENGFSRQIDVFNSYEEALKCQNSYNEPLDSDEYLNIIYIDYDENEDEIGFGSVV